MAEAARKPTSERMYGKRPRIAEESEGDEVRSRGGAPERAEAAARKTAGNPPSKTVTRDEGKSGTEAKGDAMAGTDGIETHHTHSGERTEMHHRHMAEHKDMHHRHEREHLMRAMGHHHESHEEMNARHHGEKRRMHTRHEAEMKAMGESHAEAPSAGIEEADVGNAGTEPT